MKRVAIAVFAAMGALASIAATYGPWGDSDAVKNPDKLGPTYLMSMPLQINGVAAVEGDCVAVYRKDTDALCGLGKVLDSSGQLTIVCYAPYGVTLHFQIWVSSSGLDTPKILDCETTCDLSAPNPGSFYTGHSLVATDVPPVETKVATPVISPADGTFFPDSCIITITCETAGSSIYFTTNGATPKTSSKYLYSGPITVYDSVQIKAVATKDGLEKSSYATANISKLAMTLENAIGATEGMTVTTGGDADWVPVVDPTAISGSLSAKSGLYGDDDDEHTSWLQVVVNGPGTLTFWAKVSCEHDDDGTCTWDHLGVFVDGVENRPMRIDGETGWTQKTVEFSGAGAHTVKWVYVKDESDYDGEDCAWINGVVWTPSAVPDDPIPDIGDNPSLSEVQTALTGSADTKLLENITSGAQYNAYRTWALSVKNVGGTAVAGQQTVKDSPNAWLSYALNTEKLIAATPVFGDVEIDEFSPSSELHKFDFTVSIKNILVGNEATADNLVKVFGVEGATSLTGDTFSSNNVMVTFDTPENGKVRLKAMPKNTSAQSFFMKVKMK